MNTSNRSLSRRISSASALMLSLLLAGSAAAADIAIDDAVVEPLPGRDYSMRLDLAAARFEQIDARGETQARALSTECVAALASGLWLAVPAAQGLELLPVGATADKAITVSAGCRTAPDQAATLPPAVLQQIAAHGGGVIYVDAAGLDGAGRIAATGATR
ncbi:hypothetical protein ACFJIW_06115 [Tahibacter sp. UC22_41]|uniref:hypothetical protein n=1 Tax=Tahibacter sp. UC22_41 TaxID=3350178 RepID=UPI0036DAE55F